MLLGKGSDEFNGGYSKVGFNSGKIPHGPPSSGPSQTYERESLLQQSGVWSSYAQVTIGAEPLISQDFLAELGAGAALRNPVARIPRHV